MTELIVRIAELCEAEGRVFRAMTVRLAMGVGIMLVAAAAVAAGVALLLIAVYLAIEAQAGPAIGAASTAVIALGIGGILAWLGRRIGM